VPASSPRGGSLTESSRSVTMRDTAEDVASAGVLFRCEVLLDNGQWDEGEVLAVKDTARGQAALVYWRGITAWLYRGQGSGYPNEWRRA
jgi:hypothetical protein